MTQHEHAFLYYRSPAEIRDVQFSHRIRGLDEYEVAEFLDLLADQVHSSNLEQERLREENEQLRAENEALRSNNHRLANEPPPLTAPQVTSQAAALLMHAQQMADQLVEEAVRRSRDMLTVARAEKRAMLRNAQEAATALLLEARDSPSVTRLTPQRTWQLDGTAAVSSGL